MVVEGIWSKEILIEAIRRYDEDIMTELKRNKKDSLDIVNRISILLVDFSRMKILGHLLEKTKGV